MKLLRPVTASLLLSTLLLASTARWAATDPLRPERTHAIQQQQVNELTQRAQLEHLKRAQELDQTQRQLDQLRNQATSRPGLVAPLRAQQLHETQRQLDQLKLEQQRNHVQQELQLHAIAREPNPLRRQAQIRALQFQQQMQFLQDQSRTKRMQQELNRLRQALNLSLRHEVARLIVWHVVTRPAGPSAVSYVVATNFFGPSKGVV